MPAPKKRPRKAAARRASSNSGRRSPARRGSKKGPPTGVWIGLLLISLTCLGISVHLLIREKQRQDVAGGMERKVLEIMQQNPDAEVFSLEEPNRPDAATEKKKP